MFSCVVQLLRLELNHSKANVSYYTLTPNSGAGGWRKKKKSRKERCKKVRKEQWRTESVLVLWFSTMLPLLGLYAVHFSRKREGKSEMESTRLMLRILTGLRPSAVVTHNHTLIVQRVNGGIEIATYYICPPPIFLIRWLLLSKGTYLNKFPWPETRMREQEESQLEE